MNDEPVDPEDEWADARRQLEADEKAKALLEAAGQPADYDDRPPASVHHIGPKTLPLIALRDIPEPGPVDWLVKDLWVKGAFGIVGAEPKAWKSWLTLHLGISVGAGIPLFGRFAVQRGRVLMFAAEGGKGLLRKRAGEICRALDLPLSAVDLAVIDLPVMRLDDKNTVAAFQATCVLEKPALVILDPFREMHTGDENDAALIAALLQPLRELQNTVGCAVQLVHHMGKAPEGKTTRRQGQRLRGSSALHGAVDSALYFEARGEGPSKRVTVSAEHRAAIEPEPFTVRLCDREFAPGGKATWLELVTEEQAEDKQQEASVAEFDFRSKQIIKAVRYASMPGRTPLMSASAVWSRAPSPSSSAW